MLFFFNAATNNAIFLASLCCQVQYYERLSPLVPLKVPLGSFSKIRTGDCVVTFSRTEIYKMKVRNNLTHYVMATPVTVE